MLTDEKITAIGKVLEDDEVEVIDLLKVICRFLERRMQLTGDENQDFEETLTNCWSGIKFNIKITEIK